MVTRLRELHPEISIHSIAAESPLFPRARAAVSAGIRDGVAPAMCFGVWSARRRDNFWVFGDGVTRQGEGAQAVDPQLTFFDFASVTKVIATATLAGVLIDRGWLRMDQSLASVFDRPEYVPIQLKHLLSHTAGLIWWEPYWQRMRERFSGRDLWSVPVAVRQRAMREMILSVVPQVAPGTRVEYSDVSAMLVGFMIEEILQMPFDRAVQRHVFDPLGLPTAHYRRTIANGVGHLNFAATEDCSWRKMVLQGQVHDDNCWSMGGYSAHAGVFGTVADLLVWIRGVCGGFLSPATRKMLWTRVTEPRDATRTYGFDLGISSVGKYFSPRTVGHTGFTGTSVWYDEEAELAVVLLTNRVHPSRENIRIRAFRPMFHDAIREDLAEKFPSV